MAEPLARVDDRTCLMLAAVAEAARQERRRAQPRKDAADLAYVLRHYATLVTEKTLFEVHFDVVESAGYDLDLAAARVLGRRLCDLMAGETRAYVKGLLECELTLGVDSDLVREVAEALAPVGLDRALELLSQLKAGLSD